MKLWELRSYEEVIRLEQERLVYQARLRARYGRAWRRKAPVESLMPLKLAKYGIPLSETAPAGLAAAGITVPAPSAEGVASRPEIDGGPGVRPALGEGAGSRAPSPADDGKAPAGPVALEKSTAPLPEPQPDDSDRTASHASAPESSPSAPGAIAIPEPRSEQAPSIRRPTAPQPEAGPAEARRLPTQQGRPRTAAPAYDGPGAEPDEHEPPAAPHPEHEAETQVTVPVGPGRVRALGHAPGDGQHARAAHPPQTHQVPNSHDSAPTDTAERPNAPQQDVTAEPPRELVPVGIPDGVAREEVYFSAYRQFIAEQGSRPTARQLSRALHDRFGVRNDDGSLLSEPYLRSHLSEFRDRYNAEMGVSG